MIFVVICNMGRYKEDSMTKKYNVSYEARCEFTKNGKLKGLELSSISGKHTWLPREKILQTGEEEKEILKRIMQVIAIASLQEWKIFYEAIKKDEEIFPIVKQTWQEVLQDLILPEGDQQ